MVDTLKLLTPFISEKYKDLTLEELSVLYKETPTTEILATAFEKVYYLLNRLSLKYVSISGGDIASIGLEKLDIALKKYQPGAKFSTYYYTYINNALINLIKFSNNERRKGILECIDDFINIGIEDTYEILDLLLPNNLTKKEYDYCELLFNGFNNAQITEIMGVSSACLYNYRKSLKNKLCDL